MLDSTTETFMNMELQSLTQFIFAKVLQSTNINYYTSDHKILRLLPAMEFINNNASKKLYLKDIASTCCLSANHFHQLFSSVFNMTPHNYIRQIRLEKALRLLIYSDCNIKEIAFSVGYDDEAFFSRTFSKVYGLSPGRYRKKYESTPKI